jgi:dTDP-4-dehydrorhamnose 3,5-epimerase
MGNNKVTLQGPQLIETPVHEDDRGAFAVWYNQEKFKSYDLGQNFVQDNFVWNKFKHTLRGLHFQLQPKSQSKLVRCFKGVILDVVVDLRPQSKDFLKPQLFELSEEKSQWLFVPRGFAHGYLTLVDNSFVFYKVDNDYSPQDEAAIHYLDPEINVPWPKGDRILSPKDIAAPFWKNIPSEIKSRI